jgi:hypothetical protein
LNAPEVLAGDLDQGLLLLTDLGSRQYLAELDEAQRTPVCMTMRWRRWRGCNGRRSRFGIAAALRFGAAASGDGTVPRLVSGPVARSGLSEDEHHTLDQAFALLADNALEQPESGCIAITTRAI